MLQVLGRLAVLLGDEAVEVELALLDDDGLIRRGYLTADHRGNLIKQNHQGKAGHERIANLPSQIFRVVELALLEELRVNTIALLGLLFFNLR